MVNTADSGERALQVLESCTKLPDIIVVDQNMSSSGGKLLGHEVRDEMLCCVTLESFAMYTVIRNHCTTCPLTITRCDAVQPGDRHDMK